MLAVVLFVGWTVSKNREETGKLQENIKDLTKKVELIEERTRKIERMLLKEFEPEKYDNPTGSLAALLAEGPTDDWRCSLGPPPPLYMDGLLAGLRAFKNPSEQQPPEEEFHHPLFKEGFEEGFNRAKRCAPENKI